MPLPVNRAASVAFAAGFGIAGLSTAAGAIPTAFPANQTLLPLVVGGAFVLPALAALAYAMLCRLVHRTRNGRLFTKAGVAPIGGLALLTVAALIIAGYLQPGLIPFRGG